MNAKLLRELMKRGESFTKDYEIADIEKSWSPPCRQERRVYEPN